MQKCIATPNDPDIVKNGTFVERAIYGGNADVRRAIKQGLDVNDSDENQMTALHWACYLGKQPMVKLLLTTDIDVDARDIKGNTAMHYAVQHSNTSIPLLAEAGAAIDVPNQNRRTPLLLACEIGKVGAVKTLCELGAEVNIDTHAEHSLVWLAIDSYSSIFPSNATSMVRSLLKAGASIGSTDSSTGDTELHRAAAGTVNGRGIKIEFDLMKVLINAGLDPWQRNASGDSPLSLMDSSGLQFLQPALKKSIKGRETEIAASIREVIELRAFQPNQNKLSDKKIFELLPEGASAKQFFLMSVPGTKAPISF